MRERFNICLSQEQLLGSFSDENSLESYLWKYLFPPVFLIGVLGNLTELFVLFSPGMRNRANNLLSAMAFADTAFLLCMLPHSLVNYSSFALNYIFRIVYFHTKHELVALANWTSAAAIWFMLAVCVDRLIGIKSPLYSCKDWKSTKTALLLFGIVASTGLLTSFNHVAYQCFYWSLCNGTQVHTKCFSKAADIWLKNETNPTPQWLKNYIRMGTMLHALLGIMLPTLALIALNVALVRELKKRSNQPLLSFEEPSLCGSIHRSKAATIQRRQERRVTITVCALVCCFILTQGPSSLLLLWNIFINNFNRITNPALFYFSKVIGFTPIIGKATNFFLFCFISSSFRNRLRALLLKKKTQSSVLARVREFSHRHFTSTSKNSANVAIKSRFSAKNMSAESQMFVTFRKNSAQILTCITNSAPATPIESIKKIKDNSSDGASEKSIDDMNNDSKIRSVGFDV